MIFLGLFATLIAVSPLSHALKNGSGWECFSSGDGELYEVEITQKDAHLIGLLYHEITSGGKSSLADAADDLIELKMSRSPDGSLVFRQIEGIYPAKSDRNVEPVRKSSGVVLRMTGARGTMNSKLGPLGKPARNVRLNCKAVEGRG